MNEMVDFVSGTFDLAGYGWLILQGSFMTIRLSLFSLLLCLLLGLAGALAKLSSLKALRAVGYLYTTAVRSVPDLVLMLIIFYGLQTIVSDVGERIGVGYLELDPFVTGVLTLGFIYGAYFAETFRGAIISIPRGQLEAASAYGMSAIKKFLFIVFPQMMRNALPGIGNNWLVLVKATALVSLIGLADLVEASQSAGKATFRMFYFLMIAGGIYLLLTMVSGWVLNYLERKYSAGFARKSI
ncbi:ABC transporter permease [Pseudomonas asiatica]|uniref:ABC transporter permease n=1 Tax=Pseudomonas asiatica TaxID=2219225 RepID=UPI0025AAD36B|nr:ABC transporter permease subunit [Pseudomonas asiatica]MDM9590458.1 ABC transporter permease subunit [Pseudomonas asiatica]